MSDKELIQRAKEGDAEAYKELFNRYKERVLGYLYCYIGDYQKAEDITLEAFLDVYKRLPDYEEEGKFLAWVYKIATNFAKKEFRGKKAKEVSLDKPIDKGEGRAISLGDLLGNGNDARPDYNIRTEELYKAVEGIMNRLEDKYRAVLILCDMQGLSYEEAAYTLNCSKWAVGMRLTRARRILYEALREDGYV
jgi:RNA polymerase sigma-70 factor (ECF subfamily)